MKLSTFVERLAGYDLSKDQSRIAEDLQQLATNRTLLSEHLFSALQTHGFSTRSSLYGPYGYVLYSDDTVTVRLGFWSPIMSLDEKDTFIYGLNHTHDFELYCVGYCGDGYTTVIRSILERTPMRAGVRPSLGEERTIKLAPGSILHMPRLYEVHRQLPPKTLSASLSLIIHPRTEASAEEAWCFDENYVPTYPGIATQETALFERVLSLLNHG